MQTSRAFEYSWLLDLAPAEKDVVQQGRDIPNIQALSNFGFRWGASHTKTYSAENFGADGPDTQFHQHE